MNIAEVTALLERLRAEPRETEERLGVQGESP
jgi:hypothetical protein